MGAIAAGSDVAAAGASSVGVDITDTNIWLRTFTSLPEANCRVKLRDLLANSDIVDLSEGAIGIP